MVFSAKRHVYEEVFPLSRDKVWELLSRTDHLNRIIGLFPIHSSSLRFNNTDFIQELSAKVAGVVPMRWKEHPFQWVKDVRYDVIREYRGGPLKRFFGGIELEDAEALLPDGSHATRVKLFAEFTPANLLGIVAIPVVGVGAMRKTMKYLHSSVRLKLQEKEYLLPQPPQAYAVNREELDRLADELRKAAVDEQLVQSLREHLLLTGDDQVVDMHPYELADNWKVDRETVLRMFLHATKLGVTNLSWHLICPNCRVSKSGADTMSGLQQQYHCDFCGINYEANFDRYVELCFSVHPNIRRAYKQTYCVGGPMITPHIYAQMEILPDEEAVVLFPDVPEPLRLRVLRANQVLAFTRTKGISHQPNTGHLEFQYDGSGWSVPNIEEPLPGVSMKLQNRSGNTITVALEMTDWEDTKVTASKVTLMHEFRSMFSSEVLAPGLQVGIENVTLLFSDLLGSTAFYEQVGDAHAYGQVRKHFDFLVSWVNLNKGTLVKTIGDAVMAVFEQPENALKTALDIQIHADEFNSKHPSETPIVIKIGLHHGPAIVVNSNHILDYFGRTVNLAARTQGLSIGHDIVISRECLERPGVRALLQQYPVQIELFEQRLKGIDEVIRLARVRVNPM
jgi:adenylate cyclase